MSWILRSLGLGDATPAERRAVLWTAAMFCAALASTFVLRPIRDQFGVDRGVERMPYLYSLTLVATLVFVPAFWWLANRMPSRRFVPVAIQAMALGIALLFGGLLLVGDYDWSAPGAVWVGEGFWGFFSALNVALPSLVWIHAVEHFRREQALRLFGLVGVGGTLGAMLGALLSGELVAAGLPPSSAGVAAFALLQVMFVCHRLARRACVAMRDEAVGWRSGAHAHVVTARVSAGGVLEGLRLLQSDRYLWGLAGYMALLGMVGTAFYVVQTDFLGRFDRAAQQAGWLAHVDLLGQGTVLVVQLFFTGRLLRRLPPWLFLVLMPLLSVTALGTLTAWPLVSVLGVVQILRRGTNYALEKPSREVLYTPLGIAAKHKVKILLDTFVHRAGDLLGACLQVLLWTGPDGARRALVGTIVLAALWAALGAFLGVRSVRRAGGAEPALS